MNELSFLQGNIAMLSRIVRGELNSKASELRRLELWEANLRQGDFEYEFLADKPRLVLAQFPPDKINPNSGKTEPCLFCGNQHLHGYGEGHRIPHCTGFVLNKITHRDGTIVYKKDGYVIKLSENFAKKNGEPYIEFGLLTN